MRITFPQKDALKVHLFFLSIICISAISMGCNSNQNCRREIGLLRAEIIDMEDKHALLKSKYEGDGTNPVDTSSMDFSITDENGVVYGEDDVMYGDTIYEGVNQNGVIYSGGRIYPHETTYTQGTVVDGPIYTDGPFPGEIIETIPAGGSIGSSVAPRGTATSNTIINQAPRQPENLPQANPRGIPGRNPSEELPLPPGRMNPDGSRNLQNRSGPLELEAPSYSRQAITKTSNGRVLRSNRVTEVVVNRSTTRGHSVDGIAGDEGLNLLIQPKASSGQIVLESGELTVSLIDPKETSGNQQLGLWKFLPEETELFFVNDELASHGILLHLPWDQATPRRSRLMIHVRFVTSDGRILRTSSDVRIKPPTDDYSLDDPRVVEWTQQDWRWGSGGEASDMRRTAEGVENGDAFDLGFVDDEIASGDGNEVVDDDRWMKSRGYTNANGFRRGSADRASQLRQGTRANNGPEKPQWRPVR